MVKGFKEYIAEQKLVQHRTKGGNNYHTDVIHKDKPNELHRHWFTHEEDAWNHKDKMIAAGHKAEVYVKGELRDKSYYPKKEN